MFRKAARERKERKERWKIIFPLKYLAMKIYLLNLNLESNCGFCEMSNTIVKSIKGGRDTKTMSICVCLTGISEMFLVKCEFAAMTWRWIKISLWGVTFLKQTNVQLRSKLKKPNWHNLFRPTWNSTTPAKFAWNFKKSSATILEPLLSYQSGKLIKIMVFRKDDSDFVENFGYWWIFTESYYFHEYSAKLYQLVQEFHKSSWTFL